MTKISPPKFSFKELTDLKSDLEKYKEAEAALSRAYIRLRDMIPGAFDTPHAPSREQVWETTEHALQCLLQRVEAAGARQSQ